MRFVSELYLYTDSNRFFYSGPLLFFLAVNSFCRLGSYIYIYRVCERRLSQDAAISICVFFF